MAKKKTTAKTNSEKPQKKGLIWVLGFIDYIIKLSNIMCIKISFYCISLVDFSAVNKKCVFTGFYQNTVTLSHINIMHP